MPDLKINSFSVKIVLSENNKKSNEFAKRIHASLLLHDKPLLAILKQGNIYFDILTIFKEDVEEIAQIISNVYSNLTAENKWST